MERRGFHTVAGTDIHARPVTLLVQIASRSNSDINLEYSSKSVNLESIMGVVSLSAGQGADVTITTDGNDAKGAIEAITDTVKKESLAE